MKKIAIVFVMLCIIVSSGCTSHEKTLYDILDNSMQQTRPTLLFVSNPTLGNYNHYHNILKDEQVQNVLTDFHFVERKTTSTNEIHQLLYTHRHNFFLILNADSIYTVVPMFYSKETFISFLKNYRRSTLSQTINKLSLLNHKDSLIMAHNINVLVRSNYQAWKGNISKSDYINNIKKSIKEIPYFYNRYLLTVAAEDYTHMGWLDSLRTNERNIYNNCINELKHKKFHIPQNVYSNIRFNHTSIDLGQVPMNGEDSCLFTFTNESDVPAVIYHVKPTCGCTIAEWPKAPIQKGDSSHIKIVFKGENEGFFKKKIKVSSNSENPEIMLTISGTVIF